MTAVIPWICAAASGKSSSSLHGFIIEFQNLNPTEPNAHTRPPRSISFIKQTPEKTKKKSENERNNTAAVRLRKQILREHFTIVS